MEYTVTNSNFEELVLNSEKPVILDFWAAWCGPCKMLAPVIEEFAKEHEEYVVGKVNVDEEMELARKFKISAIPTVVAFKNGEVVGTHVGFASKEEISSLLQ